jgi:peptidoglycan/LPS O-acetylase OafA/YrhL
MVRLAVRELRALTSLRFFAAATIVLHHSRGHFGIPRDVGEPVILGQAVGFFFVLSGFILTYVYPALGPGRRGAFMRARVARLWPAHLATFLLLVALLPAARSNGGWPHTPAAILTNVAMLQSWLPFERSIFSYNGPSWSISTELFFYLSFPFLIDRWEKTWPIKLLLALGLALAFVAILNRAGLPQRAPDGGIGIDPVAFTHPFARLYEFVLGMTAALAYRRLAVGNHRRSLAGTLAELVAIVLALGAMYYASRIAWHASFVPLFGPAGRSWLMRGPSASLFFALLIVVMALERGFVSRFLAHQVPVLLGEISYSIYLIHQVILQSYALNQPRLPRLPDPLGYVMFWLVLLTSAYLLWAFVERPCRRLLVEGWPRLVSEKTSSRGSS